MTTPKQVIVVRKDLNMRKGKIVAQTSHASLGTLLNYGSYTNEYQYTLDIHNDAVHEWLAGTHAKICVYVNSEQELLDIYADAMSKNVNVHLVRDLGLTEFNGVPTLTCLAIGPDWPENIDPITGHLPLL
jgi:PTH2 family peptidyl-tRNA hydrolase